MHMPPIWREARCFAERVSLQRDPVFGGAGVPHGHGRPVLLIPGYLAGDVSLALLAGWLRRSGFRAGHAGMRMNVDCGEAATGALERRLEERVGRLGERVIVIGHSRGGGLARLLAVRRPDLVSTLITLGTPSLDPLAVHPILFLHIGLMSALGTLGVPGVFSLSCLLRRCCARVWEDLARPLDRSVRFVSIYSRTDGVVDWRACLDPAARNVHVDASHVGMTAHAGVYRTIAAELSDGTR